MIAIVCDTPYQLTSALLVYDQIAKGEPIIFFMNRYLYFKEQTFHYSDAHPHVAKILYYGRKHMAPGRLLSGLIKPLTMLKTIDGYEKEMDITAIIASRTTFMATYLYKEYAKRHPLLPIYLVEEGIGEYTNEIVHTRFTKACSMLKQDTHMDHISRAYFSAPELYPYRPYFPIEKTPGLTASAREIIESVMNMQAFRKKGNPLDAYHCIFLSEPNSCEMKTQQDADDYEAMENRIMDTVANTVGLSDMIIKVHPIDPNFKKEGIETFYSQLPMETLLFTMRCDNKVFVAPTSTAMLTPKLLYDEEPYLVFTYQILDPLLSRFLPDAALRRRYYDFIDGVIGMYREKDRCAIPQTIEELTEVLARFSALARGQA